MLTVLIGPPAGGKSTWARAADGVHIATDDLRVSLTGDVQDHRRDQEVADAFDAAVLAAVAAGVHVIAENGANERRGVYLAAARAAGVPARAVVFEDYHGARIRSADRRVPHLSPARWEALAARARAAAAEVAGEGWDSVARVGVTDSSRGQHQPMTNLRA